MMLTPDIEKKVADLVQEALAKDEPPGLDENLIDSYGADSLDTVEIVLAVEEEFEIEIPDSDFDALDTVRKIAAVVDMRVNCAAA
jgi:acyl carrier protein